MRDVFIKTQLEPFRVDQHQLHFVGAGFEQDGHHERVDEDAFASARGAGDKQVRHGRQFRHANPPVQVAPHCQRQLARRLDELRRFDDFAQRDGLASVVWHFDADGGFAGNSLNEDGFGLQSQAQIFGQCDNAAVLDAGFRLEFECRDNRARVDLRHAPLHVKFLAFCFNRAGALLQFLFVEFLAAFAFAQQGGRRKFVVLVALGNLWLARFLGRRFFRVAMKNKNRRLHHTGLAVLFFVFFPLIGQGAARFQKCRFADRLRRHRLSARKARFFHAAAHAFLFAALVPGVPACLGLL